jgi:glycosyltransferase involved in cell wall biosynthesis
MKFLFITSDAPVDIKTAFAGIQRRMAMFVQALGQLSQLDVLIYVPSDIDCSPASIAERERALAKHWQVNLKLFQCTKFDPHPSVALWQQQIGGIFSFFQQPTFIRTSQNQQVQALEACLARQPDAIFVHRLHAMCPLLLTQKSLPPIFFDLDDIEHIKLIRSIEQPAAHLPTRLYYLHVPTLWHQECRAMRLATRTFICSNLDHAYLAKRWNLPGITVIPNAISIPKPQPITSEPTLLLIGTYTYPPNLQAANFLLTLVFPLIQQMMPHAKLIIAGKCPEEIYTYQKGATGVEFTGFVDDLDTLYSRARVVCCPIFSGGGTRVKMIEAAAYGKPIVATRIGAEGLELIPDEDFLLRNSPFEFAEACIELLQNDDLSNRLGEKARAKAIEHYDRANVIARIRHHIQPILQPSQGFELTYSCTSSDQDAL